MTHAPDDLVYWSELPDGACALNFSEQGWAIAGACAEAMDSDDVQELMLSLVGQVIGRQMHHPPADNMTLHFEWMTDKDATTGKLGFLLDTLPLLSEVCNVADSELQTTIQLGVGERLNTQYRKMAPKRH